MTHCEDILICLVKIEYFFGMVFPYSYVVTFFVNGCELAWVNPERGLWDDNLCMCDAET